MLGNWELEGASQLRRGGRRARLTLFGKKVLEDQNRLSTKTHWQWSNHRKLKLPMNSISGNWGLEVPLLLWKGGNKFEQIKVPLTLNIFLKELSLENAKLFTQKNLWVCTTINLRKCQIFHPKKLSSWDPVPAMLNIFLKENARPLTLNNAKFYSHKNGCQNFDYHMEE